LGLATDLLCDIYRRVIAERSTGEATAAGTATAALTPALAIQNRRQTWLRALIYVTWLRTPEFVRSGIKGIPGMRLLISVYWRTGK
jgi:hypothetical protein